MLLLRLLQLLKQRSVMPRMLSLSEPLSDLTGSMVTILTLLLIGFLVTVHLLACFWFSVQVSPKALKSAGLDTCRSTVLDTPWALQAHQRCRGKLTQDAGLLCSWLESNDDLHSEACDTSSRPLLPYPENQFDRSKPRVSSPQSPLQIRQWVFHSGGSLETKMVLWLACLYWSSSAGDGFTAGTTAERACAILGQILVVNCLGAFIIANLVQARQEEAESVWLVAAAKLPLPPGHRGL